MTVRAFDIKFKDEAVQTVNLKAGTWTFHAFVNALTYSIGLKDSTGVWHNYDLSDQTGAGWYDVQETITTDFDAVEISLLNNVGTAQVLFPMHEKGSRKSVKRPHEKDIEEAAIIKSASWEIHTSSPVIYKDAPDLTTDGAHTPVTVTGRHWVGSVMTEEGFLTVTANDETEAANASPSPVTIAPLNNADKHTYTIRLYNDANKTELLDYETIPVVFKGAKGVSAIRLHINNPVDVLPADSDGNVLSFTGTGTGIHVFEGAVELDYDGAGTANGKFKVTAVPTSITMGAITDGGNICVVADATAMAADKASIVYTVTGKTLDGFDFTVSGEQNFTKTKMGQDAVAPIIINGHWAFWDETIQDYVESAFSAIGDDGHSPYVDGNTGTWWEWNDANGAYQDTGVTAKGEDGTGILDVVDWYAISTDGTTAPGTGWQTTMPSKPANYYLWNYEVITYTDGRTPTQTQKRVIQGKDARSIYDIKNAYAYSASDTVSPISGWQWSLSALGTKPAGYFLWVREDIAYTDNPSNYFSTIGYVVRDGEPGLPGDPGTGVDRLRTEYYLSTSSTTQTGGTWQTTVPVWVSGTYIWERIVTVMSDLTEVTGTPYLSRTWETINQLQADIIEEQAKTQFQTTIDGGLIYTALMKLFNPSSGSETAGISGNNETATNPAFYAGGTYSNALSGTAKAIIRHDGTVKFTDGEFTGQINSNASGNRIIIDAAERSLYMLDANSSKVNELSFISTGNYSHAKFRVSAFTGTTEYSRMSMDAFGMEYRQMSPGASFNTYANIGNGILEVGSVKSGGGSDYITMQVGVNGVPYIGMGGSVIRGFGVNVRQTSSSTTMYDEDVMIQSTASSTITVNLPSSPNAGRMAIIARRSGGGNVTVNGNGKQIYSTTSGPVSTLSVNSGIFIYDGNYWQFI